MELKENLKKYIEANEVVFQAFGDLMEISNDCNAENKKNLIKYLNETSSIEIYEKDHPYISEEFQELNDWSQKEDVLFFLTPIGVLICITKKEALENKLIAA